MSEPVMKMVHNCATNESYVEEIVGEELEQLLASQAEGQVRAEAEAAAHAELKALGLTDEEIAALVG